MKTDSEQPTPLNPKFAGAIFFAIYGVLIILFSKYALFTLQDRAILPLLTSIPVAVITGAFLGGCFGKSLAKERPWYLSFCIGLLIACLSLLLGSIAILLHYYFTNATLLNQLRYWQDYFIIYGAILASLTVTVGIWFILLTGFVALYFNKRFLPGLIAADRQRLQAEHLPKPNRPDDKQ
jgi:hypothetical protein